MKLKPNAGKISMTIARFCCLLALAVATRGAALTVDDFDDAVTTKLQPPVFLGVVQSTIGSTAVTDPGLNGVLGGVRQLTVTATSLFFIGFDNVTAGAAVLGDFFRYSTTVGAIGEVALRYDGGGAGLNVSLYGFDHFQLTVVSADPSTPPYDATVTVEDNGGGSASSTQTITTPGPRIIAWPMASFSAVDLNAVKSITLVVASPNVGADLTVDLFQVVGPPVSVPLLSPVAMLGLVVMLSVVGLTTLVRLR